MRVDQQRMEQLADYLRARHRAWQDAERARSRNVNVSQNFYAVHLRIKPQKLSKIMTLQETPSQSDVDHMAEVMNKDQKGSGDKLYDILGWPPRINDPGLRRFAKIYSELTPDEQKIIDEMIAHYEAQEGAKHNKNAKLSGDSLETA